MPAESMSGFTTAAALAAYLGVVWWAYRTANRERFERDALLPFADEPAASDSGGEPKR